MDFYYRAVNSLSQQVAEIIFPDAGVLRAGAIARPTSARVAAAQEPAALLRPGVKETRPQPVPVAKRARLVTPGNSKQNGSARSPARHAPTATRGQARDHRPGTKARARGIASR